MFRVGWMGGWGTYQFDILQLIVVTRLHVLGLSDVRHVAPVIQAVLIVWCDRCIVDEAIDPCAVCDGC